ncbi:MAG: hypothetical protein MUC97_19545 [Bernardetiaceae bacterium]|jgi:hypothetical protein|nr:hypothetical protein [Bernardetiaceae bacterium]
MKHVIFAFAIFVLFSTNSIAQQNQVHEEYAVVSVYGFINSKTIRVDYGEGDIAMVDSTNNNQKIKSIAQALNYLSKRGWVLVSTAGSISQGSFFTLKRVRRKEG